MTKHQCRPCKVLAIPYHGHMKIIVNLESDFMLVWTAWSDFGTKVFHQAMPTTMAAGMSDMYLDISSIFYTDTKWMAHRIKQLV